MCLHPCRDNENKITVSGVSILSTQSFLYAGSQIDFIWEDGGITLHFPNACYEGKIQISVSIFRTSEENCIWPQDHRFMPPASATYKITANATLPAPARLRIEHYAIVDKEHSPLYMVAHGGPPFVFKPFYEGKFPTIHHMVKLKSLNSLRGKLFLNPHLK